MQVATANQTNANSSTEPANNNVPKKKTYRRRTRKEIIAFKAKQKKITEKKTTFASFKGNKKTKTAFETPWC
jgi:hypothetical protein